MEDDNDSILTQEPAVYQQDLEEEYKYSADELMRRYITPKRLVELLEAEGHTPDDDVYWFMFTRINGDSRWSVANVGKQGGGHWVAKHTFTCYADGTEVSTTETWEIGGKSTFTRWVNGAISLPQ